MVIVREMTGEDADRASELEELVFSMPWKSSDFLEMIEKTYAHYYVADDAGEIAGIIGLRDVAGEGEISNVAVHPDRRREGIGSLLLKRALDKCRELSITDVTLEVRASNEAAVRLYESFGFKSEGIRPGFYEKPAEDALIMWKRDKVI